MGIRAVEVEITGDAASGIFWQFSRMVPRICGMMTENRHPLGLLHLVTTRMTARYSWLLLKISQKTRRSFLENGSDHVMTWESLE